MNIFCVGPFLLEGHPPHCLPLEAMVIGALIVIGILWWSFKQKPKEERGGKE